MKYLVCFLAGIVTAFVAILWDTLKDKRTIFTIDEDYRIIIKKIKGKRNGN